MIITDHVYLCFSACLQFDAQFELSSEGAGCRSAAACLFQCLSFPFNYNSLCLFNVNIMLSIMCVRLVFVQLSLHPPVISFFTALLGFPQTIQFIYCVLCVLLS